MDGEHAATVEYLREWLARAGLEPDPEQPCSYLPDQLARSIAFKASSLPPGFYHALMDLNFRRSGRVLYSPRCARCRQCQAIRLPVGDFRPNRSQKRCRQRNQDVTVSVATPVPDRERHALYRSYLQGRYGSQTGIGWASFCEFLYESPVQTLELSYRLEGRLVAIGILDVEPRAASTVYCYYDPGLIRRGLGVLNILCSVEYCRSIGVSWLYLGYYLRDCGRMNYKGRFKPCELLQEDGSWQRLD